MNTNPETISQKMQEKQEHEARVRHDMNKGRSLDQRGACIDALEQMNRAFSQYQDYLMRILPMSRAHELASVAGLFDTAILEASQLVPSEKEIKDSNASE